MSETERRIEAALRHLDGVRGGLETWRTLRRGVTPRLVRWYCERLRSAANELEKLL